MNEESVLPAHLRSRLIGAVIQLMACCGVTDVAIRESFEQAMISMESGRATKVNKRLDSLFIRSQNLPAQLLRIWHHDDRYTDREARPRPLSLSRGRDSLQSAIRRIDPAADAEGILKSMKAVGLIRRTSSGRYLPTSESAIVDQLHPLLMEHVTKLVNRLVTTVRRNSDSNGDALSLVERHAYISDLNYEERAAFAKFTRSHGMAYLQAIDDWLQDRRTKRSVAAKSRNPNAAGVAAGVYLFAYLGDDDAGSFSG